MMTTEEFEREVKQQVDRLGAEMVRGIVAKASRKKAGRPAEKDFSKLHPVFQQDARDWLEGRDPEVLRSQGSIAKEFAEANPGHSHNATQRRVYRKLSSKRRRNYLMNAALISEAEYPVTVHLRVLEELAAVDEELRDIWSSWREDTMKLVDFYRKQHDGELDETTTMDQIRAATRPGAKGSTSRSAPKSIGMRPFYRG